MQISALWLCQRLCQLKIFWDTLAFSCRKVASSRLSRLVFSTFKDFRKGKFDAYVLSLAKSSKLNSSDAASGWAGWSLAHQEFGSSVNPITTRGADYTHHIIASPPGFENPATPLNSIPIYWWWIYGTSGKRIYDTYINTTFFKIMLIKLANIFNSQIKFILTAVLTWIKTFQLSVGNTQFQLFFRKNNPI